MTINIETGLEDYFHNPDDTNITLKWGNVSQGVMPTFRIPAVPALTTITVKFKVRVKNVPGPYFYILSDTDPLTAFTVTISEAGAWVVPLPLPFGTEEIVIELSNVDATDNLYLGFAPERSAVSPVGVSDRAFRVPR